MTRSSDLCLLSGPEAAAWAGPLWAALGSRVRRVLLWDAPDDRKPALFVECLKRAALVGVAHRGRDLQALAWLVPLGPGSRCGVMHVAFVQPDHALGIAREFLQRVDDAGRFDALLALLPLPFRHARNFARLCGFHHLARLPGACFLAAHDRVVQGVMMIRQGTGQGTGEARRGEGAPFEKGSPFPPCTPPSPPKRSIVGEAVGVSALLHAGSRGGSPLAGGGGSAPASACKAGGTGMMSEHWMETPEDAARRRLREDEARQAGEDLARTAATPEGFRVLVRLLDRWGAEAPASPDPAALALRNEAEILLARLAEVHPGACLRLVAELRGLVVPGCGESEGFAGGKGL